MIEVNDSNFYAEVIERSREIPVLADFWAPWCQPCLMLGPVLEKIEKEFKDKFVLAKINVQDNQKIAAHYGVQSIPLVKFFKSGNPVDEFVGALPEIKVREFLRQVIPNEADIIMNKADKYYRDGKFSEAVKEYGKVLEKEPDNENVKLRLGRIYCEQDNFMEAKDILSSLSHNEEAVRLLNIIYFEEKPKADLDQLENKLKENPENPDVRITRGNYYAKEKNYSKAMDEFLEAVKTDRKYNDEEARKSILKIFSILGNSDPVVSEYRKKLSDILF